MDSIFDSNRNRASSACKNGITTLNTGLPGIFDYNGNQKNSDYCSNRIALNQTKSVKLVFLSMKPLPVKLAGVYSGS